MSELTRNVLPLVMPPTGSESVADWRPFPLGGSLIEIINEVQTITSNQFANWSQHDKKHCLHTLALMRHPIREALALQREDLWGVHFAVIDPVSIYKVRESLSREDFDKRVMLFKEEMPACTIYVASFAENFDWFKKFFIGKRVHWVEIDDADRFKSDFVAANRSLVQTCGGWPGTLQPGGPLPPGVYSGHGFPSGARMRWGPGLLRRVGAQVTRELWLSLQKNEISLDELNHVGRALALNELQLEEEKRRLQSEMSVGEMKMNIDSLRMPTLSMRNRLGRNRVLSVSIEPGASGANRANTGASVEEFVQALVAKPVRVVGLRLNQPFDSLPAEQQTVAAHLGLWSANNVVIQPVTEPMMTEVDRIRDVVVDVGPTTANLLFEPDTPNLCNDGHDQPRLSPEA